MAVHITIKEWVEWLKTQDDVKIKKHERMLYDLASFVVKRAKYHARVNFGRGVGKTARTKGRSGALMNSIGMVRLSPVLFQVTAGGPGVPYAAIHELGTVGKGGVLPTIVPKNAKALTIPLLGKYVSRRATEFPLQLVKPKGSKFAFLAEPHFKGKLAYLLLNRVDIPARPFLQPAVEDIDKEGHMLYILEQIFGVKNTKDLPYEIRKI